MDNDQEGGGALSNLEVALADMAALGDDAQPVLTDAAQMGLPARRRRYYVFFVKVVANRLLRLCRRAYPSAMELLLEDGDGHLE
eukprot:12938358-Prorocentrum_lima.AAC.1